MHYRPAKAHVLRRRPREAELITFDTSPQRGVNRLPADYEYVRLA